MNSIEKNIAAVKVRIENSAHCAGRNASALQLLAVSKTRNSEEIKIAVSQGLKAFGENYVQEALVKINNLKSLNLEWHFIGPLQSNKTKQVAENFNWAHTVDRLKIARRLNDQRPKHLGPLSICLQVNIDNEATKSGVIPNQACELALSLHQLPNLRLRGLMAIPEPQKRREKQRQPFKELRLLRDEINRQLDNSQKLDTLSMGMSGDIEAAILEGATILRVGTDIFGPRTEKVDNKEI